MVSPNFGIALNIASNWTDPSSAYLAALQIQIYWTGGGTQGFISLCHKILTMTGSQTTGVNPITSGAVNSVFSELKSPNSALSYPANNSGDWNYPNNLFVLDGSACYTTWSAGKHEGSVTGC